MQQQILRLNHLSILVVGLLVVAPWALGQEKPNIVVILADDVTFLDSKPDLEHLTLVRMDDEVDSTPTRKACDFIRENQEGPFFATHVHKLLQTLVDAGHSRVVIP